jgi:hypothetical protein
MPTPLQSSISSEKKWVISALSALIFILLSSPQSYRLTNKIFEPYFCIETIKNDKPTWNGIIIHGIVFMLVTRYLMNHDLDEQILDAFKNDKMKSASTSSFSVSKM